MSAHECVEATSCCCCCCLAHHRNKKVPVQTTNALTPPPPPLLRYNKQASMSNQLSDCKERAHEHNTRRTPATETDCCHHPSSLQRPSTNHPQTTYYTLCMSTKHTHSQTKHTSQDDQQTHISSAAVVRVTTRGQPTNLLLLLLLPLRLLLSLLSVPPAPAKLTGCRQAAPARRCA